MLQFGNSDVHAYEVGQRAKGCEVYPNLLVMTATDGHEALGL